ncbi:MAG TPA: Mut7-C RNAse domain-containing protein [Myxococcota bacterium]
MAVPCPGCGRSYDEAHFAHGRTLHCACGTRVAGPLPPADPGAELRFAVDAMLGRLARWLRLLGFDAWYEGGVADEQLVRRALDEQRWILTRDRALPVEWRAPRVHLVAAETPFAQLQEVAAAFGLAARARPFARCSRCNAALVALAAAEAALRVPPAVRARHAQFRGCPTCGRIYWEGSHVERMRRVLARLDEPDAGPPA